MLKVKFQPEYILVSLIIFSLPFNWFLKLTTDDSFLRGIQIDYLLPKIYLQDILLFCLATYFVYSFRHQLVEGMRKIFWRLKKICLQQNKPHIFSGGLVHLVRGMTNHRVETMYLSLILILGLRTIVTQQASSYASLLQIASVTAFAYYLYKRFSLPQLLKLVWPPLVFAAILQSIIGIYQYIFQKSVLGYTLFGEINLSLPGAIARESYFGSLRALPYGTLPHPNILAGFLGFTCILVWFNIQSHRKKNQYLTLKHILLGLFIFVILLTQSWVAISGIITLFIAIQIPSKYRSLLLFYLYLVITILYLLLPKWFDYQSIIDTDNSSIIRRIQLNVAGFSVLKDHVWLGTGLNQSLMPLHTTYSMLTPADFIQPIHSIYLIWLVETGIIGTVATTLVITGVWRRIVGYQTSTNSASSTPTPLNSISWLIPLLFIAWLGIFDHYLLTIRQGQLLVALVITLTLSSNKELTR